MCCMQGMHMDIHFEFQATQSSELQTSIWLALNGTADLVECEVLAAFRQEFSLITADELW